MSMANEAGILLAYAIGMFGLYVYRSAEIRGEIFDQQSSGRNRDRRDQSCRGGCGNPHQPELPDRGSGRSLGRARGADAAVFPEHMTMT